MEFSRGDKVEVCSKQEGFVGSYYVATVIKNYENEYTVQYKKLVAEDDQSRPLIETVGENEHYNKKCLLQQQKNRCNNIEVIAIVYVKCCNKI